MTDLLRLFSTNVRRRRNQIGLSQDALAERADLHRTYIGAIEREEKNPTLRSIARIAAALEIEPWKLIAPAGEHNRG